MAFVLYLMLEPREVSTKGADVVQLAGALGRKPGSVCKKIGNIQAHDANRTVGKGLSHGNKFDKLVWEMYEGQGELFLDESIALLSAMVAKQPSGSRVEYASVSLVEGKEKIAQVRQRVNQNYFRNSLLKNYGGACCLTGLSLEPLLIASHIKPWSDSTPKEKVAASNGILLNAFHDKAFDSGLITIDDDYRVIVSSKARRIASQDDFSAEWLLGVEGRRISVPEVAPPDPSFIHWHNEKVFVA